LETDDLLNRPVSLISSGNPDRPLGYGLITGAKSTPRNFSLMVFPFQSLERLSSSFWESDPRDALAFDLSYLSTHFLKLLVKGLFVLITVTH
jgi:hypothetical protein